MKKLILLLLISLPIFSQGALFRSLNTTASAPASPPALITQVIKVSSNSLPITTSAVDSTGSNLIVCAEGANFGQVTPTDSKSNTYVAVGDQAQNASGTITLQWYVVANATVGTGHTVSTTALYPSLGCLFFSNMNASPYDGASASHNKVDGVGSGGTGTTFQSGAVVPSVNNSVVLVAGSDDNGNIVVTAINSGITFGMNGKCDGCATSLGYGYLIQTPSASINPTLTTDFASNNHFASIIVLKPQ